MRKPILLFLTALSWRSPPPESGDFGAAYPRAHRGSSRATCWKAAASASAAATSPPNTSPPSSPWPAPSRPAITAPIFRACRWWASKPRPAPRSPPPPRGQERGLPLGRRFRGRQPARSSPTTRFEADAVFVGHGIAAPEYKWDDFKGVDVAGKMLVAVHQRAAFQRPQLLRRPRAHLLRPLDLQVRRGAAPRRARRPHHPHHAHRQLRLGRGAQFLGPRNAVRETGARRAGAGACRAGSPSEAGDKLLALAGNTVDELLAAARKARFPAHRSRHPHPRHLPSKIREIETRNVAAIVPGSDPKLKDGSGDLQRALGPPRHRHAGERRRHLQRRHRQRHRLRHPAGTGARLGRAAAEAAAAPRCSCPSPPKRAG